MSIYLGSGAARIYLGATMPTFIYRGDVPIWLRSPMDLATQQGSGVPRIVPEFAAWLDIGVIGGGGGGATGGNGTGTHNGEGGNAAAWATATIPVTPGDEYIFTIGSGGAGASGGTQRSGTAGTPSTAVGPGLNLTSAGGTPGIGRLQNDDTTGHGAAQVIDASGKVYPSSPNVGAAARGSDPGGGGGGSPYPGWFGSPKPAGRGGDGMVAWRWRSY